MSFTSSRTSAAQQDPLLAAAAEAVMTATLVDGVLQLAARSGDVAVRVPVDPALLLPAPAEAGVPGTIARVCALDSALARRLFRRVSAWRPDEYGNLSARVRPTA